MSTWSSKLKCLRVRQPHKQMQNKNSHCVFFFFYFNIESENKLLRVPYKALIFCAFCSIHSNIPPSLSLALSVKGPLVTTAVLDETWPTESRNVTDEKQRPMREYGLCHYCEIHCTEFISQKRFSSLACLLLQSLSLTQLLCEAGNGVWFNFRPFHCSL